jgi:hypothetical protein
LSAVDFGYVLARRTVAPLLRYHLLKQRFGQIFSILPDQSRPQPKRALRESADALTACYHQHLPYWYRLWLSNHNEAPLEAARHLRLSTKQR